MSPSLLRPAPPKGLKRVRASTAVTVQDVAHHAGVSKTTAASILRNAPDFQVSKTTRHRVLEAAKQLGYQRNAVAVALSSGCTNTVGLLLPLPNINARLPASRIYGQDIFVAVFQAASRAGLRVTAIPMPSGSGGRLSVQDVTDRSVDGLVMASMRDAEFVHQIYDAGIPCVEIGSGHGKHLFHPDNKGGAQSAVAHLVELGHRRILHWRGAGDNYAAIHRCKGFLSAVVAQGLCPKQSLVVSDAEEMAAQLHLPPPQRPTAVFAYNDFQALTTLDVAREIGLRVPEDLSVIGFDDNILAESARPQLTTVRNPLGIQADAAIQMLQGLWHGEKENATPYAVPTQLILRQSTGISPSPQGIF
ncbi:MAG: LacI family transcriptional regulator [Armatimonadetes bacterium]|nr:LacI family transcriptional regulator [Armatimonadota bacterium]